MYCLGYGMHMRKTQKHTLDASRRKINLPTRKHIRTFKGIYKRHVTIAPITTTVWCEPKHTAGSHILARSISCFGGKEAHVSGSYVAGSSIIRIVWQSARSEYYLYMHIKRKKLEVCGIHVMWLDSFSVALCETHFHIWGKIIAVLCTQLTGFCRVFCALCTVLYELSLVRRAHSHVSIAVYCYYFYVTLIWDSQLLCATPRISLSLSLSIWLLPYTSCI